MRRWLAALALLGAAVAQAADFPARDKPITIVVPFAAEGTTDRVSRDFAEALHRHTGTTVAIENVAGAAGSLGADKVARAAPDGYTLLLNNIAMAALPVLVRNLSFQPETSFEPLGVIDELQMALFVRPGLPATPEELGRWAVENRGHATIANSGVGTASQLCAMLVQRQLKVPLTHVPYKGMPAAMADLMGERVDLLCDQAQMAPGGDARRAKTVGNPPMTLWHALYAPRGTPPEILRKLNEALRAVLRDPEFVRRQQAIGAVPVSDSRLDPGEHRRFLAAESAKWSPIIKAAGINAE